MADFDTIVIGGGLYGSFLAWYLGEQGGQRVALVERESALMQQASLINQARVHNGYHYPRSVITAIRSHANYGRFLEDFPSAIVDSIDHYYGIARHYSLVTADRFVAFCSRIGLPLKAAPEEILALFESSLVESVFAVEESVFHARDLRKLIKDRIDRAGVLQFYLHDVRSITEEKTRLQIKGFNTEGDFSLTASRVFNCSYSGMSRLLRQSGFPRLELTHQRTELVLVEIPYPLRKVAITVVCGPFFSCLPFPLRGLHSLSHVNYTPHQQWKSGSTTPQDPVADQCSNVGSMIQDAQRFLPLLGESRFVESLWSEKVLLPQSQFNDGRPILVARDHGILGHHCIVGGKVDNVYDLAELTEKL